MIHLNEHKKNATIFIALLLLFIIISFLVYFVISNFFQKKSSVGQGSYSIPKNEPFQFGN